MIFRPLNSNSCVHGLPDEALAANDAPLELSRLNRMAYHPKPWRSLAEGVGFEPTSPFGEAVFKTAALNHSAIPPLLQSISSQNFIPSSFFSSTTKE